VCRIVFSLNIDNLKSEIVNLVQDIPYLYEDAGKPAKEAC